MTGGALVSPTLLNVCVCVCMFLKHKRRHRHCLHQKTTKLSTLYHHPQLSMRPAQSPIIPASQLLHHYTHMYLSHHTPHNASLLAHIPSVTILTSFSSLYSIQQAFVILGTVHITVYHLQCTRTIFCSIVRIMPCYFQYTKFSCTLKQVAVQKAVTMLVLYYTTL